jgi:hypothetical protein
MASTRIIYTYRSKRVRWDKHILYTADECPLSFLKMGCRSRRRLEKLCRSNRRLRKICRGNRRLRKNCTTIMIFVIYTLYLILLK